MCDFGRPHHHHDHDEPAFGFLVDTPEIRELIDETIRLAREIGSDAERVAALRPAFARLLAADGWLPSEYAAPDKKSGMGGGIGQYALYRAEDGSLCLFSLVVPAGSSITIVFPATRARPVVSEAFLAPPPPTRRTRRVPPS